MKIERNAIGNESNVALGSFGDRKPKLPPKICIPTVAKIAIVITKKPRALTRSVILPNAIFCTIKITNKFIHEPTIIDGMRGNMAAVL